MAVEFTEKQYDFSGGPNYTDSPFAIGNKELAESDNMIWDTGLKVMPGAAKLVSTVLGGASPYVTSVFKYEKNNGNKYWIVTTDDGRIDQRQSGNWTNISSALTSGVIYPRFLVFNDTLLMTNGTDQKKWDGTTFADIAGTPPNFTDLSCQGDYVLGSGHSGTELQYSDTGTHAVWPGGNVINIGLDDGEQFRRFMKHDEYNFIFKDRSIWYLSGNSPLTFDPNPVARLGTRAPNSVVWTRQGIFFWSEGGPTIFTGRSVNILTKRMSAIMDTVDWSAVSKIHASYDPIKNRVYVFYQPTGASNPTKGLILFMDTLRDGDVVFWPFTQTTTISADLPDSNGRTRPYFGTTDGYVLELHNGTQWAGSNILGRARSKIYWFGNASLVWGVRDIDVWADNVSGNMTLKVAMDGATSFTTLETFTMSESGTDFKFHRHHGDNTRGYLVGRCAQLELTNGTTGHNIYGWELGATSLGRRDD